MFNVFDKYLIRQMLISTLVVSCSLSMVIMLAQSLRLIEVVLEANASASAFLTMMILTLPRFFEAVMPASVLISTLFVLNRMSVDSEVIVMRAGGASPWRLSKPVFSAGIGLAGALVIISLWLSPMGVADMQRLQKKLQSEFGHLIFREGIFNSVGSNLTAYVRSKSPDGQLLGLMVHDTRGKNAVTVVARSGNILSESAGQKIIVYDGSRQEVDKNTGKFSRLDFRQYTLDIPSSSGDTAKRWQEPEERTFGELTSSINNPKETLQGRLQFRAELHRRITTPILMLSFCALAAAFLLQGSFSRSGQMKMIITASLTALFLQGFYLVAFNIAKKKMLGCVLLYGISITPLLIALFFLLPAGERLIAQMSRALQAATNRKRP